MELLKHELYKIFTRKSIYIAAAIFLVIYFITSMNLGVSYENLNVVAYNRYKELEGPLTNQKIEFAGKLEKESKKYETVKVFDDGTKMTQLSREGGIMQVAFQAVTDSLKRLESYNEAESKLSSEIEGLKKSGKTNTFEYREKTLNLKFLTNLDPSQVVIYVFGWADIINFINAYGFTFTAVLMLLALSPMFSEEYSSNVDSLILSSKNGKTKIVTVKIIASVIFVLSVILSFAAVNFVAFWMRYGLQGGYHPLQVFPPYQNSVFNWSLSEYYVYQLLTHIIAAIAFGLLVLLFSSLSKSSLVTFFAAGGVFGIPLLLNQLIGSEGGWVNTIYSYSYSQFLGVKGLFEKFKALNFFGYPVLYPTTVYIFFSVVSIIIVFLTFRSFKNHQVS